MDSEEHQQLVLIKKDHYNDYFYSFKRKEVKPHLHLQV